MTIDTPYTAVLTREHFLFHEMRIVAKLMTQGFTDEEIKDQVFAENLFQYPTTKTIRNIASVCLKRLHKLDSNELVELLATESAEVGKQVCLYAMMKYYRLVWDFMIGVLGEKFKSYDYTLSRMDVNLFFRNLQEQNDTVAKWYDSTIAKIKQVLIKMLLIIGYVDSTKLGTLHTLIIHPVVERVIKENGDDRVLGVFESLS